jgi:hypothetical protein
MLLLAGLLWFWAVPQTLQDFRSCVFVVGAVVVGLGTIFGVSEFDAFGEHLDRQGYGTSMTNEQSEARMREDMAASHSQSTLLLTGGSIAVALVYIVPG